MKGYLIANVDVHDREGFEKYRDEVAPLVAKFGGRYLVRGGEVRNVEGDLGLKRLVLLEFPTLEDAQRFYDSPEYAPVLQMRLNCSNSDVALVAGYEG